LFEKERHYISGKMIDVYEAPEPDNIRWENLSLNGLN
jgi:hypothetical protein